jgi:hypothetical protein
MLFMVMHKINAEIDAGGPPRKGLVEAMGQLIGETIQAGKLHDGAGLKGRTDRVRVKRSGGERSVQPGPYRGENELISSFAMLKVKSMEEGVEWATRYADAVGATEIEVGQVTEAWDIGVAPKPTGEVPLRVLALAKATAASESGAVPATEVGVKVNAVLDDMKRAGVFLGAESLKPSAKAARLQAKSGKHTWTDGPFAESKELVSGYTIIKVSSLAEAKEWTIRYATILGDIEVDVREVYER